MVLMITLVTCADESYMLTALLQLRELSSGGTASSNSAGEQHAILSQLQEFKRMVIQSQSADAHMHAGCTAIVALKCATTLYVANAGDSRGVLCRAGEISFKTSLKCMDLCMQTGVLARIFPVNSHCFHWLY